MLVKGAPGKLVNNSNSYFIDGLCWRICFADIHVWSMVSNIPDNSLSGRWQEIDKVRIFSDASLVCDSEVFDCMSVVHLGTHFTYMGYLKIWLSYHGLSENMVLLKWVIWDYGWNYSSIINRDGEVQANHHWSYGSGRKLLPIFLCRFNSLSMSQTQR